MSRPGVRCLDLRYLVRFLSVCCFLARPLASVRVGALPPPPVFWPLGGVALSALIKDERGDNGSEFCIQLGTPSWGEQEAGFEWQKKLEKTLMEAGWTAAEAVPCLWFFTAADGTDAASSPSWTTSESNYAICDALAAVITKKYGDCKLEREITSFKGFSIKRDRAARQLQLTFRQKIIEAAREHLPTLLQPGEKLPPARREAQKLLKSAEFRATIDALKLVEPRPAKLDGIQVNTQSLIGSLKYIAILHPRFSLASAASPASLARRRTSRTR